jgi:hypothetical protein
MTINSRVVRSALLATAALAVSASMVAASQSGWALSNAASRMDNGLQMAGSHVSAAPAVAAMANAASHAQQGLSTAAANITSHIPDDAVTAGSRGQLNRATPGSSKPTSHPASDQAKDPLTALADAQAAAHAGLTKAGNAVTNNPTSSDSAAWTGLNTASAAVDAGLAKAMQAVGTHH